MNRRDFLAAKATISPDALPLNEAHEEVSSFSNKSLPSFPRTVTGLEPYAGPFGPDEAAHLLRRATFGATPEHLRRVSQMTLSGVVSMLLQDTTLPVPPLNANPQDTGVPQGETWVNAPYSDPNNPNYNPNSSRTTSFKAWMLGLMIGQDISLREKMVLFWHNHFVSRTGDVGDARFVYRQNALFRLHAFGNFRTLAREMTTDPAMLRFLNGNTNTNASPNENYARELQELFTIGKGPEIAPGNYTTYTEDDVKAAARVLTGWRDSRADINSYFTAGRHDSTDKQFSSAYGNHVIVGREGDAGATEIDDLIALIFSREETAVFLCRKLYRWFVYYVIDDAAEVNVIQPMAEILRANDYEVKPVLSALFGSAHFFDPANRGCMIKHPLDFTVGTMRQFGVVFPGPNDLANLYMMWGYIRSQASLMQMNAGDPPNVAGWPAFYQEPQYYQLWINSDTIQRRTQFTDRFISSSGYVQNNVRIVIDPLEFVNQLTNPEDPVQLIAESAALLFAIPITENQKALLKETLIPGLPDYEWTIEWLDYKANPADEMKIGAVRSKLQALYKFMMNMAEYQLS